MSFKERNKKFDKDQEFQNLDLDFSNIQVAEGTQNENNFDTKDNSIMNVFTPQKVVSEMKNKVKPMTYEEMAIRITEKLRAAANESLLERSKLSDDESLDTNF